MRKLSQAIFFLLLACLALSSCGIPDGHKTTQLCHQLGALCSGKLKVEALPRSVNYRAAITPQRFREHLRFDEDVLRRTVSLSEAELQEILELCEQSTIREGMIAQGFPESPEGLFWIDVRARAEFFDSKGMKGMSLISLKL